MALRSEDPILKDFNLICSSDPVNLEGASLECKVQPCKLKNLYLTANTENPDLTYVLNEGAADATWDRIYHVRMTDKLCRGRKAPNPHRKPDFSHITFHRIDHDGTRMREGPRLTVKDILNRIIGRTCEREIEFLNQTISEGVDNQTRLLFAQRITALRSVMAQNPPYDEDILVTANGGGREFFAARFQGQAGYGKTHMAEYCAVQLSNIFKMPWEISRTLSEFHPDPNRPKIYLLDDWAEKASYQEVLERMNITHDMSMFLITSNTVIKREKTKYSFSSLCNKALAYYQGNTAYNPYDGSQFDMTPGMLRRLGIQGIVRAANGDLLTIDENITSTFTFTDMYVCRDAYDQIGSRKDVLSVLFRKYRLFASRPADILVLEDTPSVFTEPGVKIVADNISQLLSTLKDVRQIVRSIMGVNPTVQLTRSATLSEGLGGQTNTQMWLIPYDLSPKTHEELIEMFVQFCTKYRKVTLLEPLYIHLREEDKHFYYHNNVAYVYGGSSIESEVPVVFDDDAFTYYRSPTDYLRVPLECYLSYKQFGVYTGPYLRFELSEIIAIDRVIGQKLNNDTDVSLFKLNYYKYFDRNSVASQGAYKVLVSKFKQHPIFWVGCGLLVIAASGYGLYMLSQLLFKSDEIAQEPEIPEAEPLNPFEHRRDRAYKDSFLLPWEANAKLKANEGTADDPRKRTHPKFKANEGTADDPRKRFHPKFKANQQPEPVIEEKPELAQPLPAEIRKANAIIDQAVVQLRPDKVIDRSKFITEITDFLGCKSNHDDDKHLSVTTSDQLNSVLANASLARHYYGEPQPNSSEFYQICSF